MALTRGLFACGYLDRREHVIPDTSLFRPADIAISLGNQTEARQQVGWQAQDKMRDIARVMVEPDQSDSLK